MVKPKLGGKRLKNATFDYNDNGETIKVKYGDLYKTIVEYKDLNVKIVKSNFNKPADVPQKSATPNRIYGGVTEDGRLKKLVFTNKKGDATKRIDLFGSPKEEQEKGFPHIHVLRKGKWVERKKGLTKEESELIEEVKKRYEK